VKYILIKSEFYIHFWSENGQIKNNIKKCVAAFHCEIDPDSLFRRDCQSSLTTAIFSRIVAFIQSSYVFVIIRAKFRSDKFHFQESLVTPMV
jgi:hypothetical protein